MFVFISKVVHFGSIQLFIKFIFLKIKWKNYTKPILNGKYVMINELTKFK